MVMLTKRTEGYRRIELLIETMGGEEEFLDHICGLVIEGNSLKDVGVAFEIAYGALWRWVNDERWRFQSYETALKGHADLVVHETKVIADNSDDPKLMVDTRKWLSSKWDSNRFSEKSKVEVGGSVSLISLLSSLKELPSDVPSVIEGEADEVFEFFGTSPEKIPAKISENEPAEQVVI